MKIVLFGATGMIGQRILNEALARGHQVTAVVREPSKLQVKQDRLSVVKGDVLDTGNVAEIVRGHDAVIAAVNNPPGDFQFFVRAALSLIDGLKQAGVKRLIVVGGAGSLEVAPGVKRYDTPDFPEAWRSGAKGLGAALEVYRANAGNLDWTFISPADVIMPGERTGKFRTGGDQMLFDAEGKSKISAEDYAIALLDELEHPANLKRRMTVAY